VMPRMNGREMAEQLKETRREAKFLFMTGYAEFLGNRASEQRPNWLAEIAIMQKPFSKKSLLEKVRAILTPDPVEQLAGSARERIG
jgi:two-component SAPR family response regulator